MATRGLYFYIAIIFFVPDNCRSGAPNTSTSSTPFQHAPTPLDSGKSMGNTNNNSSNWLLILLLVALFIVLIIIIVQVSFLGWKKLVKSKRNLASERQLLLQEQDIETVETQQQPRPNVRISEPEEFGTSVLVPIKQQLPVAECSDVIEDAQHNDIPKGLVNTGNSCFFNAVLQCLSHIHLFGEKLYAHPQSGELTISFKEFLNLMQLDKGHSFVPNYLFLVFCNAAKSFADGKQHDCHECLRHFLDNIRKEEKESWKTLNTDEKKKKTLTLVDKLLGGHFMNVYSCKNCGTPFHIVEPFLDISLPVILYDLDSGEKTQETERETHDKETVEGEAHNTLYQQATLSVLKPLNSRKAKKLSIQKSQCNHHMIEECFRHFTKKEVVKREYLCNTCSVNEDVNASDRLASVTRQTVILNPPAILTVQLKRFKQKSHGFVKHDNKILFEELLDISPFCSSWCMRNERGEENIWYALFAVIVHTGSLKSGHYVAYVKVRDRNDGLEEFIQDEHLDLDVTANRLVEIMKQQKADESRVKTKWQPAVPKGTWYRMNDSDVSRVSSKHVLDENAYLLFYERISSNPFLLNS